MDNVAIYVMSAGHGAHQDYRWRLVQEDSLVEAGDALDALESLQRQVDSHKNATAILERVHGALRLVISGIPTNRSDWISRQITIDLALFGPDDAPTERVLRGTLASMLSDPAGFSESIERTALFDQSSIGWAVDGLELTRVLETQAEQAAPDAEPDDFAGRIAPYDPENARSLAEELRARHLPKRNGVLAIAADYLDAETLGRLHVWRGLSTMIESAGPIAPRDPESVSTNCIGKYRRTLITLAVVGIAAIGVILLLKLA